MSRLMSVAMTTEAVRNRTKTVTRRKGWWLDSRGRRILHAGDRLTLCEKVQGRRKKDEPLVRIAEVEVVSVRRESLGVLYSAEYGHPDDYLAACREVTAEGFPGMSPDEFVERYFVEAQGMDPFDEVTRIAWRYLDEGES